MKRKLLLILGLVLTLTITACSSGDSDKPINEGQVPPVEDEDKDTPEETPEVEEPEEETPEEEVQDEEEEEQEEAPAEGQGSSQWPEDFLANAPKLEGEIEEVKEEGPNKYYIKYNNVSYEDAEAYIEEVKQAGFNQDTYEHIAPNALRFKGLDDDYNLERVNWFQSGDMEIILVKKNN